MKTFYYLMMDEYGNEFRFSLSVKSLSSKQARAIHDRRATRRCQSNKRNKTRHYNDDRLDKSLSQTEIDRLYNDTEEADWRLNWQDNSEY